MYTDAASTKTMIASYFLQNVYSKYFDIPLLADQVDNSSEIKVIGWFG
jgi:hypothetical protein